MHDCVAIRVLLVDIGAARDQEPNTVDLIESGGECERILAEVKVAFIVGLDWQTRRLFEQHIASRVLLVLGTEEPSAASLVDVRTRVE